MRTIVLALAAILAFAATGGPALAADRVSVRAILIVASPQKGASDPKLAPFEATLRRILRFETYRAVGEGSASVADGGRATLSLGQGHSLELSGDKSAARETRVRLRWRHGGRELMNTALALPSGRPAVLGGPAHGDKGDVWAVIIIAN
jgi:hypothetical protein